MSLQHVMDICHMTRESEWGDSANVRSSLATKVQLQREVKAAPRGVAEALGYLVLRSEQADAIEKSVISLYLFQLAQGREPMFCLPAFGL